MAELPDELLHHVLEVGVYSGSLDHQSLCRIALASRRLNRLSRSESLWRALVEANPRPSSQSERPNLSWKDIFKLRYERERETRLARHRRQVLRAESRRLLLESELRDLDRAHEQELELAKQLGKQIEELRRARSAGIAIQAWQPAAVQTQHTLLVEQQPADPMFRELALKDSLRLCNLETQKIARVTARKKGQLGEVMEEVRQLMTSRLGELAAERNKREHQIPRGPESEKGLGKRKQTALSKLSCFID